MTDLIVVEKPSGVLTVPSREGANDPRPCLGINLQKELGRQIFPIHRLDFEVSGLVIFALTREAQRVVSGWFEHKKVHKIYRAWTQALDQGPPPPETIRLHLRRGKKRAYVSPHGQMAETQVKFLGRSLDGSQELWELRPLTGKSHQLRVTMAEIGRPIVGDSLYGSKTPWPHGGIALKAVELSFADIPEREKFDLPIKLSASLENFSL